MPQICPAMPLINYGYGIRPVVGDTVMFNCCNPEFPTRHYLRLFDVFIAESLCRFHLVNLISLAKDLVANRRNALGSRFETSVRSHSRSKVDPDSIASVHRHRQLPSVRPGTFMRASAPRFSKS